MILIFNKWNIEGQIFKSKDGVELDGDSRSTMFECLTGKCNWLN